MRKYSSIYRKHKSKKHRRRKKAEQMKNRRLIKKYPWLMPRGWNDKKFDDYDYTYTVWRLPGGWDKAFGDMMLEELGAEVHQQRLDQVFRIDQIKEKYGELRVYVNAYNGDIDNIINKYTTLSRNICIGCGKPDVPVTDTGWIEPYCYDCFARWWGGDDPETAYKKASCDDGRMQYNYTFIRYEKVKDGNKKITYDISETAEKIRKRWEKRRKSVTP